MTEQLIIEEQQTVQTDKEKAYDVCPRCGAKSEVKANLAQSDVTEFVESVLAGTPYTKDYPLYNGAITLTISAMRSEDLTLFSLLTSKLAELEKTDSLGAMACMDKLRVLLQIKSITKSITKRNEPKNLLDLQQDHSKDLKELINSGVNAVEALNTVYTKTYKEFPLSMLSGTVVVFSMLYNRLLNQGFDSNFWNSAGI